jgi:hypothetical protein
LLHLKINKKFKLARKVFISAAPNTKTNHVFKR